MGEVGVEEGWIVAVDGDEDAHAVKMRHRVVGELLVEMQADITGEIDLQWDLVLVKIGQE